MKNFNKSYVAYHSERIGVCLLFGIYLLVIDDAKNEDLKLIINSTTDLLRCPIDSCRYPRNL